MSHNSTCDTLIHLVRLLNDNLPRFLELLRAFLTVPDPRGSSALYQLCMQIVSAVGDDPMMNQTGPITGRRVHQLRSLLDTFNTVLPTFLEDTVSVMSEALDQSAILMHDSTLQIVLRTISITTSVLHLELADGSNSKVPAQGLHDFSVWVQRLVLDDQLSEIALGTVSECLISCSLTPNIMSIYMLREAFFMASSISGNLLRSRGKDSVSTASLNRMLNLLLFRFQLSQVQDAGAVVAMTQMSRSPARQTAKHAFVAVALSSSLMGQEFFEFLVTLFMDIGTPSEPGPVRHENARDATVLHALHACSIRYPRSADACTSIIEDVLLHMPVAVVHRPDGILETDEDGIAALHCGLNHCVMYTTRWMKDRPPAPVVLVRVRSLFCTVIAVVQAIWNALTLPGVVSHHTPNFRTLMTALGLPGLLAGLEASLRDPVNTDDDVRRLIRAACSASLFVATAADAEIIPHRQLLSLQNTVLKRILLLAPQAEFTQLVSDNMHCLMNLMGAADADKHSYRLHTLMHLSMRSFLPPGYEGRFSALFPGGGMLMRHCSSVACTNLDGFSDASLCTQLCAGCRRVRYCTGACQRLDWRDGHRLVCTGVISHV